MWPFKKERVFNVKIISTGYMSNKSVYFEFTGVIDAWQLKYNGAASYAWHQIPIERSFKLDPDKFDFVVTELEKGE
tara:strand:- start:5 stop:232 length:228 start_codon:yes stop_codon:yes gene_type:complete